MWESLAKVTYAGPQNFYPGLDQLNIVIPPSSTNLPDLKKSLLGGVQGDLNVVISGASANTTQIIVSSAVCDPTLLPFGGGSGTMADPYLVCSRKHLDQVRNFINHTQNCRAVKMLFNLIYFAQA